MGSGFCIKRSLIWSSKKEKWLYGPLLPSSFFLPTEDDCATSFEFCILAKNRTSAIVIRSLITTQIFNFATEKWTSLRKDSIANQPPLEIFETCFQRREKDNEMLSTSVIYALFRHGMNGNSILYSSSNDGVDWNFHVTLNQKLHILPVTEVMNGVMYLFDRHPESQNLSIYYMNSAQLLVPIDVNVTIKGSNQFEPYIPLRSALSYIQASCPMSKKDFC